ncbi:hypothetical protein [Pseudorhodoplanes sinuspersici]|uniref:Uncharacterized protein n=1 Tax=Pseudorhodoplanes sinuspersici TaxID=1235591 RepID=A0A1W6ZX54_9HYPH|nr:hypothetical protein [Pseudorhodoplanes sinuspersici]ARQ01890.1 hypothetical protein CAK95_24420 [Pseudorhodoplanes sinuspersici]RKE73655.1 hypothetical protein DFP91_1549 [Pseudorhodoplanes sinuspersici]
MKDLMNSIHCVPLIVPVAARTDNTAIVSAIIDRKGYESLALVIVTGTNTDANATFSVLVEDGNASNLSDNAAVPDSELNGTEALAGFTAADDDNKCRKIGYVGNKRYVRVTVTPSGNDSGNIFLAGVAILGNPDIWPTANPPA